MKKKKAAFIAIPIIILCAAVSAGISAYFSGLCFPAKSAASSDRPIKWAEFNVPYEALRYAMEIDIETYDEKTHISWIDILAYLAAGYGGSFDRYEQSDIDDLVKKIKSGRSVAVLTKDMGSFPYYSKVYGAVLGGMLGEYQIKTGADDSGKATWKKLYGLKAFSPLADGYRYTDFDDFGKNRSYGYSRRHLGHDMMTPVGTPVTAVESGIVEALGWNRYGGWRIGIRSYDKQRYYYYAHLQKDEPFAEDLRIGSAVTAGDVIGYTGQTGYSVRENVNNIETPHLHFGMQLVFDEDAKDDPTQIWVDLYAITKLLSSHRCTVVKNEETDRYERKYPFVEENYYLKERLATSEMTTSAQLPLPVIMYHSILAHPKTPSRYIISPDLFEEDLRYIKKNGYTPVFMKDVIAFVEGRGELPKKPIVLTFDDGYYNNYHYAFPLLKKYGMKAVISIVGKMTDEFTRSGDKNPNYAYVSWDEILEMHLSGYWEIQNHSYDCHHQDERDGMAQRRGESYRHYKEFLTSDIMRLQNDIAYVTGVAPNTMTYPFGSFGKNTNKLLTEMGFKATLSCSEGVSTITKGDESCLYRIKRHLRPPDVPASEFFTFLR